MIWTNIHRYAVYALVGAALFGAGAVSSTANYNLPGLWNKAAQVPRLQAENRAIKSTQTHSKSGSQSEQVPSMDGINCPMRNGALWRPPMAL